VAVLVVSFRTLRLYSTRAKWRFLVAPAALLGVCVVVALVLLAREQLPLSPGHRVNGRLQEAIREAVAMAGPIDVLTTVGNLSVALVVVVTPLAVCLLLYSPEIERAERVRRFHHLMYWTALLLVVGVVQVTYQNRMPGLFFDDEFNRQRVGETASASGLMVGAVFTVALGLVFLPAASVLGEPAAEPGPDAVGPTRNWLAELLAVLAPVLTALPVGRLFELAG
jgi:hypothetical protein